MQGWRIGVVAVAGLVASALAWHFAKREAPDAPHADSTKPPSHASLRTDATRDPLAAVHADRRMRSSSAATETGLDAQQRDALHAYLRQLASREDPRARVLYALLSPLVVDDTAGDARRLALEEAARMAPDDPMIAWLYATQCGDHCSAAVAHVIRADSDNAASWVLAAAESARRGDQDMMWRHLERAGAAPYYDEPFGETVALVRSGLDEAGLGPTGPGAPDDDQWRDLLVFGIAAAWALPGHGPILDACTRATSPLPPRRHHACRSLLIGMSRSRLLLTRMLGVRGLVRLTAGHPEGPYWREQYRQIAWARDRIIPFVGDPGYHERLITIGEWPAMVETLRRQGIGPAPAGWLPADADQRALVLTGRPPSG